MQSHAWLPSTRLTIRLKPKIGTAEAIKRPVLCLIKLTSSLTSLKRRHTFDWNSMPKTFATAFMVIAKSKQTKVDQEVDLCPPPWTPCLFWFFQSFSVATVPTWDVICSRIHLANFDSQIRLLMAPPGSLDFFQKSCIFRITHAWAGCVYGCRHKEKEKTNWYVLVCIYIYITTFKGCVMRGKQHLGHPHLKTPFGNHSGLECSSHPLRLTMISIYISMNAKHWFC